MKFCPYCKYYIEDDATKCKFCKKTISKKDKICPYLHNTGEKCKFCGETIGDNKQEKKISKIGKSLGKFIIKFLVGLLGFLFICTAYVIRENTLEKYGTVGIGTYLICLIPLGLGLACIRYAKGDKKEGEENN